MMETTSTNVLNKLQVPNSPSRNTDKRESNHPREEPWYDLSASPVPTSPVQEPPFAPPEEGSSLTPKRKSKSGKSESHHPTSPSGSTSKRKSKVATPKSARKSKTHDVTNKNDDVDLLGAPPLAPPDGSPLTPRRKSKKTRKSEAHHPTSPSGTTKRKKSKVATPKSARKSKTHDGTNKKDLVLPESLMVPPPPLEPAPDSSSPLTPRRKSHPSSPSGTKKRRNKVATPTSSPRNRKAHDGTNKKDHVSLMGLTPPFSPSDSPLTTPPTSPGGTNKFRERRLLQPGNDPSDDAEANQVRPGAVNVGGLAISSSTADAGQNQTATTSTLQPEDAGTFMVAASLVPANQQDLEVHAQIEQQVHEQVQNIRQQLIDQAVDADVLTVPEQAGTLTGSAAADPSFDKAAGRTSATVVADRGCRWLIGGLLALVLVSVLAGAIVFLKDFMEDSLTAGETVKMTADFSGAHVGNVVVLYWVFERSNKAEVDVVVPGGEDGEVEVSPAEVFTIVGGEGDGGSTCPPTGGRLVEFEGTELTIHLSGIEMEIVICSDGLVIGRSYHSFESRPSSGQSIEFQVSLHFTTAASSPVEYDFYYGPGAGTNGTGWIVLGGDFGGWESGGDGDGGGFFQTSTGSSSLNIGAPCPPPDAVLLQPDENHPFTLFVLEGQDDQTVYACDRAEIVGVSNFDYVESTCGETDQCCVTADCPDPLNHTCVSQQCLTKGELRFTLSWYGDDDLDLHVITPGGFEISFGNTYDPTSGGYLDLDDIPPTKGLYVENIVFPSSTAPKGKYTFFVNNFSQRSAADGWHLQAFLGNVEVESHRGTLFDGEDSTRYSVGFD